jgi:Flp pilus assembly protein TadD
VLDTLALVQRQRKDKTGALASAQAAVKLDPKDAGLMLTLAEMQLWNGDREAARRSAALVQQLKPAPALDARLRDLLSRI